MLTALTPRDGPVFEVLLLLPALFLFSEKGSQCINEDGLGVSIHLPQPPKC